MAFCQNCGTQISDKAVVCVKCGAAVSRPNIPVKPLNDDDDIRILKLIIPIGRSGWSIAAGYLGLLSLIPFVGIFAIFIGIVAICDIKKHPDKCGLGRAWFGLVMGVLTSIGYMLLFCGAAICD